MISQFLSSRRAPWPLMLLTLTLGCATTPKPPEVDVTDGVATPEVKTPAPVTDPYGQCVTPQTRVDVQTCARDRGASKAAPVEWGSKAGRGTLYFGRLMCEDGADPAVRRVGSGGKVSSEAPEDPAMKSMMFDIVDLWEVTCPGKAPQVVYHNLYRCGDPCPPAGLSILPAQAEGELRVSLEQLRADDIEGAWVHGQNALKLAPESERLLRWNALLAARRRDAAASASYGARALAKNPDRHGTRILRAQMLLRLGKKKEAARDASYLESNLKPGSTYAPTLMCLQAELLRGEAGKEAQMKDGIDKACQAGSKRCCSLQGST